MEGDININYYDFEGNDIAEWWGLEDNLSPESDIFNEFSAIYDSEKHTILNQCHNEFYDLKEDIFSTPEDNQIIEKTEEENIINDAEQTLEGDQEKDQKIVFYNIWEEFDFNPNYIKPDWIWFNNNLISIKEKTIKTDDWDIFIVREWKIYDWNKSIKFHIEQIKRVFDYSDQKEIFEAIRKWLYSWNQKYDFESYDKNINLLSSLKYVWLLQNTPNPKLREEYIQEVIWYYNSATKQKEKIDMKTVNIWSLKDIILKSIG